MSSLRDETRGRRIRDYRSGDLGGFLDLYETVWDRRRDAAWFRWRFEENPYVDHVPMVVARSDGDLVGAEPCLVFRLRSGETTTLGFQPADWIVHPDHRRQGLFTSMTEATLDRYADGPAGLYYNFPSDAILPGLQKQGWRVCGTVPTFYRIQNPSAVVAQKLPSGKSTTRMALALGRMSKPLAGGYLELVDRYPRSGTDVSVEAHETLPVETLTALYERTVPEQIHVQRDADFYRWRFDNPDWSVRTYVASSDGGPVAALVVGTECVRGCVATRLLDVLPLDGSAPEPTLRALVHRAVDDASGADMVAYSGTAISSGILCRCGFQTDDSFPLSYLSRQSSMVARPVTRDADGPWPFEDRNPADVSDWTLSMAGQDIG